MTLDWRHRLRIRLARLQRWEFWPAWLFYIPVVLWITLLGLRFRHFTLFTAANPGMDDGGVVGERKSQMLVPLREALADSTPALCLIPAGGTAEDRLRQAQALINGQYPVVLKPDIGQRGRGVLIARTPEQVQSYLALADFAVIVQKFVSGKEFGIFVYRDTATGRIEVFSITAKEMIHVHGDGRRNLGQLILAHPRAWLIAPLLFARHRPQLHHIPANGAELALVEVGSHCRGAVFLDATRLGSEALRQRMQEIADAMPGFHFGRLDIIAPDRRALTAARELQVLEVNGVTSEAAHVYHPGASLLAAYRCFFRQWQLAFEIGRKNQRSGAPAVPAWRLLKLFIQDLKRFDSAEQASSHSRAS